MPGAAGIMRPCAESLASLSRLGVRGGFQRGEIILLLGGEVAQTIEHDQRQLWF
jgi:hypothetical protein